jgi:ketosteroid isomerase-like protein
VAERDLIAFRHSQWTEVEIEAFDSWLSAYGRAWETLDPDAFAALFTPDAAYHETPFGPPVQGADAVREYLAGAARTQERVKFSHEVLSVSGDVGIARWRASFVRVPSGAAVDLDGIFLVVLNDDHRCSELREWWHRRETPSGQY